MLAVLLGGPVRSFLLLLLASPGGRGVAATGCQDGPGLADAKGHCKERYDVGEVLADQDSLYLPAPCKCVLTAPFPAGVTYDKFWDALISSFKTGYKLAPNFKDGKLVELGDDHFITYSHFAVDGAGERAIKMVYRADKMSGTIYEESRLPIIDTLVAVGVTKVHQDPLQVEYWRQYVNLERLSGLKPQSDVAGILKTILGKDISVQIHQESPSDPNSRSAVSPPLDDFITADALWEALLDAVKTKKDEPRTVLEMVEEKTETNDSKAFRMRVGLDAEAAREMGLKEFNTIGMEHEASRTLRLQTNTPQHTLVEEVHFRITTNPLRLESFRFIVGSYPLGNQEHKSIVEQVVTRSLQTAQEL